VKLFPAQRLHRTLTTNGNGDHVSMMLCDCSAPTDAATAEAPSCAVAPQHAKYASTPAATTPSRRFVGIFRGRFTVHL
jgi:hypothetical protein